MEEYSGETVERYDSTNYLTLEIISDHACINHPLGTKLIEVCQKRQKQLTLFQLHPYFSKL